MFKDNDQAPYKLSDTYVVTGETYSTIMLPDTVCDITGRVKNVVKDVMGEITLILLNQRGEYLLYHGLHAIINKCLNLQQLIFHFGFSNFISLCHR